MEKNVKRRLKRHIDAISRSDPHVARAVAAVGYPLPRIRARGFATFLSIIISQQISTHAARAIWERLTAALPVMDAETLLKSGPETLRQAGLSGRKIEYATDLARRIVGGQFAPEDLDAMDDETAIERISALRGFGRWSAEIYLMFSLQRADVFPADDLALRMALRNLKELPEKPTAKAAREMVSQWRPYRSAGSVFLWHYYRGAPT